MNKEDEAYLKIGEAYQQQKNPNGALSMGQSAVRLNPNSARGHMLITENIHLGEDRTPNQIELKTKHLQAAATLGHNNAEVSPRCDISLQLSWYAYAVFPVRSA